MKLPQSSPRILMGLAVLSLVALFIWPMWRITLFAPQYPDGVTMYIYINKLGGNSPGTLQNINILNHYVGMKYIEPESIPELTYFPYVIGGLMLFGAAAVAINRRQLYLTWAIVFLGLAALGIYDFYLWEYDYGHNLSDTAPIKIPGASFQPPVIGEKMILNFLAQSYPHTAGIIAGLAIPFSLLAWLTKKNLHRHETSVNSIPA